MGFPTFNTAGAALDFCQQVWRNRVQLIANDHAGMVIADKDPGVEVAYGDLTDGQKNDIKVFGTRQGVKVYDRGWTSGIYLPEKSVTEEKWFINYNVDTEPEYKKYLTGTSRDGMLDAIPADWFGSPL